MNLIDFSFDLPETLIARYPTSVRSQSRLFCTQAEQPETRHQRFDHILQLLHPNDLLVFNDTKVIPARLFGQKKTGGRVEVLVERLLPHNQMLAQVRVSKPPRPGDYLYFAADTVCEVIGRQDAFYILQYHPSLPSGAAAASRTLLQVIEEIGQIPLPPYMQREAEAEDRLRYQTVYAKHKGSVAAPTAGLHFDEALLAALSAKGIAMADLTLHIGAGTFAPVRVTDVRTHQMHAEYLSLSAEMCQAIKATRSRGGRVVAVGTTSLRALETAAQASTIAGQIEPYDGETRIFIYPGYQFKVVDALITNLHLPASTLMMLVCAFGGHANMMAAYREAVEAGYRFYSYGDAMWVERL